MEDKKQIIENLFEFFPEIRYVAIYRYNELFFKQRDQMLNSSSSETDKYEELLVNPTLLTMARQRGNIDCGGLKFIIIAYGNFYQCIKEIKGGHISVCLDKAVDLNITPDKIVQFLNSTHDGIF